jgi:hypothetical protein
MTTILMILVSTHLTVGALFYLYIRGDAHKTGTWKGRDRVGVGLISLLLGPLLWVIAGLIEIPPIIKRFLNSPAKW